MERQLFFRYWTQFEGFNSHYTFIWSINWLLVCISAEKKFTKTPETDDEGYGRSS